jgi:hypothetical protein
MAALVALSFGAVTVAQSLRSVADDGTLPEKIRINLDGSYARYVGTTATGQPFLITNAQLVEGARRRYFVTFYLFDPDGSLRRSQIDEVPEGFDKVTALASLEKVKLIRESHIASIGPITYGNIAVRPFQVLHDGASFGLIAAQTTTKAGQPSWQVSLQPGAIVTFRAPWNGNYGG